MMSADALPKQIRFVQPVLPDWDDELKEQIHQIFRTGMVSRGQYLEAFEQKAAEFLGVKYAIAVSSCTTGLMLAAQALDWKKKAEIQALHQPEVIVPAFTFMATASALVWAGVKPVWADVDPQTWTLDPEQLKPLITPQTVGILAVHTSGNPAACKELEAVASWWELPLLFDAASGFGSLYQGKPVGGYGDMEVFSLGATKLLACGEGGLVTTNSGELADRVRIARDYGNNGKFVAEVAGFNARLPEFNCLLGIRGLETLEAVAEKRNWLAAQYREKLKDLTGIGFQQVAEGNRSSFKDFTITIDEQLFLADAPFVAAHLEDRGIQTRRCFAPSLDRQPAFKKYPSRYVLPETKRLSQQVLSLPITSQMDESDVLRVANELWRLHSQLLPF